jgi:peptidoglycan pentaglycine glycine transferase (the second and third glycine)/peptidoglycan pentaglycine glycine transferase (the fourth and fifth glycine)
MRFSRLTLDEYMEFMENSPREFITQLPEYGKARAKEGIAVDYVGVIDTSGAIQAAALVTFQRWKVIFQRAIINYGPTLNWSNLELVNFFFSALLGYMRRHHPRVIAVSVCPLVHKNRYDDIQLIGPDPTGTAVIDEFTRLGMIHIDKEFYERPDIQIRFIYSKRIAGMTFEEATATLSKSLRRRFHYEGRYGVEVRFLPAQEFYVFDRLHGSAAERTRMEAISETSQNLFRDLMDELGPDRAFLCVAYVSPTRYMAQIRKERDELAATLQKLESRKPTKARDRDIETARARFPVLDEQEKAAQATLAEFGDNIPFNSALSFICGRELILLLGGMDKRFANYGRDYPVERAMFKLACDRGLDVYNTFGVSGNFTPEAIDAPVLAFKRMLNGTIEEFIGTYVLPVRRHLAHSLGALE